MRIKSATSYDEWILGVDFNEVCRPKDKDGRGAFNQNGADKFNEEVSRVIELDMVNGSYTWSNGNGHRTRGHVWTAFLATKNG